MDSEKSQKNKNILHSLARFYFPTYLKGQRGLLKKSKRLINDPEAIKYLESRILMNHLITIIVAASFIIGNYFLYLELASSYQKSSGLLEILKMISFEDTWGSIVAMYAKFWKTPMGQSFLPIGPNLEVTPAIGFLIFIATYLGVPFLNKEIENSHFITKKTKILRKILKKKGLIEKDIDKKSIMTKVGAYVYLDSGEGGKAIKEDKDLWMLMNLRSGTIMSNDDNRREYLVTCGFRLPNSLKY